MARHFFRSQGRRRRPRNRNQTYGLLVLLIVVAVIAFALGPFGKKKNTNKTEVAQPESDSSQTSRTDMGFDTETTSQKSTEPAFEYDLAEIAKELSPEEITPEPNLPEVIQVPDTDPNPNAAALIAEATALLSEKPGRIIEARWKLNEALQMPTNNQQQAFIKSQLSDLADQWLFSKRIFPDDTLCGSYLVQRGDLLSTIAKKFNVPWEIVQNINKIRRPEVLQAGEQIKVINGPFHAKVYRSTFTMDLYLQDSTFVRSFKVGLGKSGSETPTGLWRVRSNGKLVKPPWPDRVTGKTYYPEDPDYPLGSRWIGLEGIRGNAKGRDGFGIHGTKDPEQIGAADSRGCIRMHNGDAILIYNLLMPKLSTVEVVE
jgi:hypothetical protein